MRTPLAIVLAAAQPDPRRCLLFSFVDYLFNVGPEWIVQ
jgi:hypothetical protein